MVGAFGGWQSRSPVQHTIAGMSELCEQLLLTRLCTSQKTHTSSEGEALCGLYGKAPESVDHIMSGCGALAQSKYLSRHDSTLKVPFYDILLDLGLSQACVRVGWRISLLGRTSLCTSWRCHARIVKYKTKWITTLEISCPLVNNREKRSQDKTLKYAHPLSWKLKLTAVPWLRSETTQQNHSCPYECFFFRV